MAERTRVQLPPEAGERLEVYVNAGTYRQNDSVDVVYEAGGRRTVASGLPAVQE